MQLSSTMKFEQRIHTAWVLKCGGMCGNIQGMKCLIHADKPWTDYLDLATDGITMSKAEM